MTFKIDKDTKPIAHDPPYKWLDPSRPWRKPIITKEEVLANGMREPDPALYQYDTLLHIWRLKHP